MLKLDKSQPTQTLAIFLDSTASIDDLNQLALIYSQSYDLSNGQIDFTVDNVKGKYRIGNVSGAQVPSFTGQYDISIYKAVPNGTTDVLWVQIQDDWNDYDYDWNEAVPYTPSALWSQANVVWNTVSQTWSTITIPSYVPAGDALRIIRAWVSGSNGESTNTYVSQNELGTYTTYNG